jgi:hypothetical protein
LDGTVVKTIRKHVKGPGKSKTIKVKVAKKRKRLRDSEEDDDNDSDYEDNSGNYSTWKTTKRTRGTSFAKSALEDNTVLSEIASNPLPGFVDPITLEEVVKPAISKYGHVMG